MLIQTVWAEEYWQQKVEYDIQVTLIDSVHQLSGSETIKYINNSPDTLRSLYFHLWPNAYRDATTMLARQKFRRGSTKIYYSPDSAFGGIELSKVRADGDSMSWQFRSEDTLDVAIFYLNQALTPGDSVQISMDFEVQIPGVLSRMGHVGHHYELTQWYPKPAVYDMKGWHPMSYLDIGEFYSEWADFKVKITLPANYRVAATGVLKDSSEIVWRDSLVDLGNSYLDSLKLKDAKKIKKIAGLKALKSMQPASDPSLKTLHFVQKNVHDFAWFADKRFIITGDTLAPQGHNSDTIPTNIWTYSLPQNLKNFRLSNDYIKQSLKYFSEWFMNYPYESVTVVDGDFSAGGGMEYPMITLINNTSIQPIMELTIMHEVGHNWFYGLSGSNEREFPWMDEGLNSYAEGRYWAAKYPDNNMLAHQNKMPFQWKLLNALIKNTDKKTIDEIQYLMSAVPKMEQAADLHSEAYTPGNYGMIAYKKNQLITSTLHAYLGDSLTTACWHEYFLRWAYKHPQPEDLRKVFEDVSGEDLSWFFDELLTKTGRIDYALEKFESRETGSSFETEICIKNVGDVSPPVPVLLSNSDGTARKIRWLKPTQNEQTFTIPTKFRVTNVHIDPNRDLPETYRGNNSLRRHVTWNLYSYDLNPQGNFTITTLPYLWANPIDKIVPGIILFHHNPVPIDRNWYSRLSYGHRTQFFTYTLQTDKSHFPRTGLTQNNLTRIKGNYFYSTVKLEYSVKRQQIMTPDNQNKTTVNAVLTDIRHSSESFDGDNYEYFDPMVWSQGRIVSTTLMKHIEKRHTLSNYSWDSALRLGQWNSQGYFGRISSSFYYRHRISRKSSIRATVFGAALLGHVPLQQNFYLASELDPEFDKTYYLTRNSGWATPGQTATVSAAHTLYGFQVSETLPVPTAHSSALLLAKSSVNIPKFESFSLHGGLASYYNLQNTQLFSLYASTSLVFSTGPLQLVYTPYRLQDGSWQTDYKRVQIALDFTTFGIRIGV